MKKMLFIHAALTLLALSLILAFIFLFTPLAKAIDPDEMLDDPMLEERAREISSELRCMVCQSESIDNSNADLAITLRTIVRERISAGDSNEDVISYIVERYGEYVLLKPVFSLNTILLWLAGPLTLLLGGILIWQMMKSKKPESDIKFSSDGKANVSDTSYESLTTKEKSQLEAVLKEEK